MKMKKCKCCDAIVETLPLLHYENMPAVAQNFPDKKTVALDKGIDLDVYECPYCGLIQLFSEPVSYYKDVIRAVAVSEDMKEFRKEYFHNFVNKCNLHGKRILEVGAGCGEYMELLAKENVQVYGIEHLEKSVQNARENGLQVYQGFVEDANTKIPDAPYDAFYIMNFLEHIPEPKKLLKGILNNMSEECYGMIEVPNGDFIFQHHMFSEFMLDHLIYFSADSLRRLLELCGFEVISCEVIWHEYILSAIVKRRKGIAVTAFEDEQKHLINEVNEYIESMKSQGRKVALWGAGHQALAFMALAKLQDKIVCVIDSAPFKQDKYTPATHIPIVAPSRIKELGIGAIVIMAGSYSKEVEAIIKREYPGVEIKTLIY